jgi:4-diphosphocytidyl-2-C-methyl-D-erythritol kinase
MLARLGRDQRARRKRVRDGDPAVRTITGRAFAKINLTLRVLGTRPDGYHELRTVLQAVALHDTLSFRATRGPFKIECTDPQCPTDGTNLVWRAAEKVWRAIGRRDQPRDAVVRIVKRVPMQSGLGGGSSDAAAAIRGLTALWRADVSHERQRQIAGELGADVPFFLEGGTALGLDRGDLLFPLVDQPSTWVTLVVPSFGVSTKDAYGWFDQVTPSRRSRAARMRISDRPILPPGEIANDLEPIVAVHHPQIARIVAKLRRLGARHSAMSGSGSAVFGLFDSRASADKAAGAFARRGYRSVVTQTIGRSRYRTLSVPR